MKKNYFFLPLTIACSLSLLMGACKKDNDDNNNNTGNGTFCNVTKLQTPGAQDITVLYDNNGRISSITDGTYIRTFSYSGNDVTILKTAAGTLVEKMEVSNNLLGLADKVRIEHDNTGGDWTEHTFNYTNNLLVSEWTLDEADNEDTILYGWKDGNLNRIYRTTDTTEITYHLDQPFRNGDYWKTAQLIAGFTTVQNANLIKNMRTKSNVINYTYTFGTDNIITTYTVIDPTTKTTKITYDCD